MPNISTLSRWGGKRAVLMRIAQPIRTVLGGHGRFLAAVPEGIERLVFVCAGNICRSPFGEYLARRCEIPAVSMGLHATTGSPANPTAMRHALNHGIDMAGHHAVMFDASLVHERDLIVAFELWQALALEQALLGRCVPVRLLGGFLGPMSQHIHDPYGLHDDYFKSCFETIERCFVAMCSHVKIPSGRSQ